ncbi:NAD(P)-dependent oxidoreductase [Lentibacter algarum]|uniref:NAD-dependent epimerase/dehydratase family protein n=1 Tax=Lentibacter algarum TaxID=576131 RepID=UPI001C0A2FBF|nr:NAD(P)-dependent oxidoreductase [Lentibacter algarum]MBU2983338.1 NAD(P)-dependent oxidoreductase [Lentibacter algarum]
MGTLNIAITGAAGFLGGACVASALAHGHKVRALVRADTSALPRGVETIVCDLAEGLPTGSLSNVDAVIHIAAAMSNDQSLLARDTTKATDNLLAAIKQESPEARLVLASSISVYDAFAVQLGDVLTEGSPTESQPQKREPYAQSKLLQEKQAKEAELAAWILRIGAVYGGTRVWNAHIGPRVGPLLMSLGRQGDVPLAHVQNVAEALVLAAQAEPENGFEVLNIVDNDLPDRRAFIALAHKGPHLPLLWRLLMPFAYCAEALLGARAPGMLRPRVLAARLRPMRYSNARAKERLQWVPHSRFGYGAEGRR